ncbi:MAG: hypothetical protein A3B96_02330 [Candidatus Spechtbacteria bacterium RIFCSPHIGHO2_02_FULL_43_15b]|nr:MAG: hypothetical protein A3B96_02330 [Candidatus Spechtbacteria bacterium RIFCSPHIGHO2_02_FULL_43_15b]
MRKKAEKNRKCKIAISTLLFSFLMIPAFSEAAVLSVGPTSGTFTVDNTFDVRIILDTKGKSVNVIDAQLVFPPDKLQVVNQSAGKSIIQIWTSAFSFDNARGILKIQGGIPSGIQTSNGLIATVTFRVKAVDTAYLKFSDDSEVLLNDGLGTKALENVSNGVYTLLLPPPAGPIVASETHPDGSKFYNNWTALLNWTHFENVRAYSYTLNNDPVDTPDDISEGIESSVAYKNLADGIHYFHIKALRDDLWGGATHFPISIDTTSAADFLIEISPSDKTISKNPNIIFGTTDSLSGISYYELKILSAGSDAENGSEPFFMKATSPYSQEFGLGSYTVIVRAYDNAGNWREQVKNFKIVNKIIGIAQNQGISIRGSFIIPWVWAWTIIFSVLTAFVVIALRIWRWHREIENRHESRQLPPETKNKLDELKRYRKKYGKLIVFISFIGALCLFSPQVKADSVNLSPPFVQTVSRNITNEEIFYIGGITSSAKVDVIIYLQELEAGQASSYYVTSDSNGKWFYSHPNFLSAGDYLAWTQTRLGDEFSPPSPQVNIFVRETALQFGASRLSYETVYLLVIFVLMVAVVILSIFIIFHAYHGRKKHKRFAKELMEAEEAIRRGFAVLRRDIQAELEVIQRAKISKTLSAEQIALEKQFLRDMEVAEKNIGKEVWDIERYS